MRARRSWRSLMTPLGLILVRVLSTLGHPVEKELAVTLRTARRRLGEAALDEAERSGGPADALHRFLVEQRLAHDAAFADLAFADFELRLDERHHRRR